MFPTLVRLSKASRRPLTSKRAGKDFYKGTRQTALPGGPRTGAPGKHVLKPYVARNVHLTKEEEQVAFGKFATNGGLTPEHFLRVMRRAAGQRQGQAVPTSVETPLGKKPRELSVL
ncbi:hypothetical protein F5146DRAFT_1107970 [Armillaria mellea]|nr:hypothetical protein F5146DRAFT_1107970 [Armillaria mellea]